MDTDRIYTIKEKNHFYNRLLNCFVLYACEEKYFKSFIDLEFQPIFELQSELEYAFMPVVFDTSIRFKNINAKMVDRLIKFKETVEALPEELWEWSELYTRQEWIDIRKEAKDILSTFGEANRKFEK